MNLVLGFVLAARMFLWFSVFTMSALKFVPGVVMSVSFKFSFWEHFLTTTGGGICGVVLFSFFGGAIRNWWQRRKEKKRKKVDIDDWEADLPPPPALEADEPHDYNSLKYRIWNRYGLVGTALLTPPILSPPVGTMLAIGFGTPKLKIITYMTVSFILWGILTAYAGQFLVEALGLK